MSEQLTQQWRGYLDGHGATCIDDAQGNQVCFVRNADKAEQIVVSVNACVGSKTQDLKHYASLGGVEKIMSLLEQELVDALQSAINQVEYMHEKFAETGSGNALVAHWKQLIAKYDK